MLKQTFYAPACLVDSDELALLHHADYTKSGCELSVMRKANDEGYFGSLSDRLKYLGWKIKQFNFSEVKGVESTGNIVLVDCEDLTRKEIEGVLSGKYPQVEWYCNNCNVEINEKVDFFDLNCDVYCSKSCLDECVKVRK